jgi:hypothetical protein
VTMEYGPPPAMLGLALALEACIHFQSTFSRQLWKVPLAVLDLPFGDQAFHTTSTSAKASSFATVDA